MLATQNHIYHQVHSQSDLQAAREKKQRERKITLQLKVLQLLVIMPLTHSFSLKSTYKKIDPATPAE